MSVVASESMEPNINKGDLVFCHNRDPSEIKNGSIRDLDGDVILWLQNPVNLFPILMVVGIIVIVKLHHNSDSKDDMETYCRYHPNEDGCEEYTVELDDLFKKKE